jgi:hypothetical protein
VCAVQDYTYLRESGIGFLENVFSVCYLNSRWCFPFRDSRNWMMIKKRLSIPAVLVISMTICSTLAMRSSAVAEEASSQGKSADMTKPVQIYILMGQSNMLNFGKVKGGDGSLETAVKEKKLYPYLIDDEGGWTVRGDVRNVRVMGSGTGGMREFNNEWLTISGNVGVEIGIGHAVGDATDAPVMILKSAIGNRALGWDLLPPGSEGFEFTDSKGKTWVHPGYKGSPERWEKGTEPKKIGWYAGMQYDGDVARAKKVLSELDKYYPGANGYEVAGFFWWQGDRDSRSEALSSRYEKNLVHLVKQLRKEFNAPNANFVCASLGQSEKGDTNGAGKILEAVLAVDGASGKYPEFKGNVAGVYTHPLSKGSSSGSHYGGNAETYMNVGEAMGKAMVKLMNSK